MYNSCRVMFGHCLSEVNEQEAQRFVRSGARVASLQAAVQGEKALKIHRNEHDSL